jgi:hypothetical protein
MDSHEEILRRSESLIADSNRHVSRYDKDYGLTCELLQSAEKRVADSQKALRSATTPPTSPFAWVHYQE